MSTQVTWECHTQLEGELVRDCQRFEHLLCLDPPEKLCCCNLQSAIQDWYKQSDIMLHALTNKPCTLLIQLPRFRQHGKSREAPRLMGCLLVIADNRECAASRHILILQDMLHLARCLFATTHRVEYSANCWGRRARRSKQRSATRALRRRWQRRLFWMGIVRPQGKDAGALGCKPSNDIHRPGRETYTYKSYAQRRQARKVTCAEQVHKVTRNGNTQVVRIIEEGPAVNNATVQAAWVPGEHLSSEVKR